ncbi:MAG: hypothetical protein K6G15_09980 [Desulfovibrio sp.]|nr:hypothetical protein [Desulfovibrio sp.]
MSTEAKTSSQAQEAQEAQETKAAEEKKSRWSFFSRKRERAPEEEKTESLQDIACAAETAVSEKTEEPQSAEALAASNNAEETQPLTENEKSAETELAAETEKAAETKGAAEAEEAEAEGPAQEEPPVLAEQENALEQYGFRGLLLIFLFLLLGNAPDLFHALQGTTLFCPREAEHISAFLSLRDSGQWIAPVHSLPAEWPGLHWLTAALALCCPQEVWLFTLTGILASALALLAVWCLSRSAGYGNAAATASGLLLLSAPLFAPIAHVYSNAALVSALCVFSLIFLSRGWRGDGRWFSLPLGFLLAGLATLTGGPFYLLLPLLSSLIFFIWCGRYRRAQKADAVFGFLCLLALLLAWLGYMYIAIKDASYIHNLFHEAWRKPWPLTNWWLPLILLGVGSLPWIFAIIFPSWIKVAKSAFHNIRASQKEHAASTFIWINLAVGLALTLCMPQAMQACCAITLICLLAPLLGKTLVRLGRTGARLFISCAMLTLLAAGLLLLLSYFSVGRVDLTAYLPWLPPKEILQVLPKLHALPIMGAICLLGAFFFKKYLGKGDTGHMLIAGAVMATLLTLPATLLMVPELSKEAFAKLSNLKQIQTAYAAKKAGGAKDATAKPQDTPKAAAPKPEDKPKDAAAPKPQDTPKDAVAPKAEDKPKDAAAPKPQDTPKDAVAPKAEDKPKDAAAPKSQDKPKDAVAPKPQDTPKDAVAPKPQDAPKDAAAPKPQDAPKDAVAPKPQDTPKDAVAPKPQDTPKDAAAPKPQDTPKDAVAPKPQDTPKDAVAPKPEDKPKDAVAPKPQDTPKDAAAKSEEKPKETGSEGKN